MIVTNVSDMVDHRKGVVVINLEPLLRVLCEELAYYASHHEDTAVNLLLDVADASREHRRQAVETHKEVSREPVDVAIDALLRAAFGRGVSGLAMPPFFARTLASRLDVHADAAEKDLVTHGTA